MFAKISSFKEVSEGQWFSSSSVSDLVAILNEKTIHQSCVNLLMTEVFKYLNGLSSDWMNEVFRLKSNLEIINLEILANSKVTFQN